MMEKDLSSYKISYRFYANERLQPLQFSVPGQKTKKHYPLYIQLTYNRKSLYFKSYYFDLFGSSLPVSLIETEEQKLIAFIIEKYAAKFSLELFKEKYNYYCRDLLHLTQPGFLDYLVTFFADEGQPLISSMISSSTDNYSLTVLLNELKTILKPALYTKLTEHAAYYAPPYLPLLALGQRLSLPGITLLPLYKWKQPETIQLLKEILQQHRQYDLKKIETFVQRLYRK